MADKFLHVHDGDLGYVPRPGVRGSVQAGGPVTIEANGFRFSGDKPVSADTPILAVGDSFTYGEDVGDLDAWPSQLQWMIGRTILNGGVSGYGLDQIVLRTERLVALHKPALVIVSMIANDVQRTEWRRLWWHDKPWFAFEEGRLLLRGVPIPERTILPLSIRRRMERLLFGLPPALQQLTGYSIRVHPAGTGATISRALIERLANLQLASRVKLVLVAQYDAHAWLGRGQAQEQRNVLGPLLQCAAMRGIETLDTFHRLAAEPRPGDFYATHHMNARGNQMIASLLAARMRTWSAELLSG
ncbi:GDSL-type esterase/lipase family protein [uncultured Reyranella sp.]|uniref:SGNH/GDSL hydrolase family protein n=1 Tax=uncultured Reyranella sp. TaxID=735512 RepID=UPI0025E81E6A|nr:GDSL-type esterase/lipase family protein [uncultured Reyranella sp.]